jgi:hypothetical protein
MDEFVKTAGALAEAFTQQGRRPFIRNGVNCYEIFEVVENGRDEDGPELPGIEVGQ